MTLKFLAALGLMALFPLRAADDAARPVPLADAVQRITVPDGFTATLFAGEPDVVQPIAMTTDNRGRLWVVECLSYPAWTTNKTGQDRVSIFEDKDGDGRFDSKKVFLNNGRNLSGIALGFGGVWLASVPELIFVPDADGNDEPDGPAHVLLDGWDLKAQHNVFNGLAWGPDGWLYGCNGILSNVKVGKPGTPDVDRVPMNCGVWRFHPTRRIFEAVAHGTTNPWGIAFNDYGQMFIANCVIKHLFHVIPGAHYERMFGDDINPYAFELIPSIADHIHWAGGFWKTEGAESPKNDVAGGGHAHCGAMIYQGSAWPERYRNTFFTVNIHGHRVNNDLLVPTGSGYVGTHTNDFMRVDDTWFRGVAVAPSHDGNMYVADWTDAGECHDYEDIHRDNGRIYKVTYQGTGAAPRNLADLDDAALVRLQIAPDGAIAAQARVLLQERAAAARLAPGLRSLPLRLMQQAQTPEDKLRLLWTCYAVGVFDSRLALRLFRENEAIVRAWAVRLALEQTPAPEVLAQLPSLAMNDASPVVRLALASGLQRLPLESRAGLAEALLTRAEDSNDANIPLMLWYAIEPVVRTDENTSIRLLAQAKIPKVRQFIARRLALRETTDRLSQLLGSTSDHGLGEDIVSGMLAALNGRRDLKAPEGWDAAMEKMESHPNEAARDGALLLSLIFNQEHVVVELKNRASNQALAAPQRSRALQALIQARAEGLAPLLRQLIQDPPVRLAAIRGLARINDPETAQVILKLYPTLSPAEKSEAINTLAARADYAVALLQSVKSGGIPARDIPPFVARQIQAHKEPAVAALIQELGTVRGVSGEKAERIARLKELLAPATLERADLSRGRAVYNRTCAPCHVLFDSGGTLAPELTGSQRANLDYLLENVVDPNAIVWDRYKAAYFETSDDRLLSGLVVGENDKTVTIQTQTGVESLLRSEIVSRRQSSLSMMPEGLFDSLDEKELIDLVAYLRSPQQVSLPESEQ